MLGVSIICVKGFQTRYRGQPALPYHPYRGTTIVPIQVHRGTHSITVPWKNISIPVFQSASPPVPLLLDVLLLHYHRYSCLCPEIQSTYNIPRQARPVEQTSRLHSTRTAPESLPMFHILIYLSYAICDELCRRYDIYPPMQSSRHCRADNRQYLIGPIEGPYCTSISYWQYDEIFLSQ